MSRCSACPGENTCVAPDGPRNASVVCIGEAPGIEENKRGRPFLGKTGREVNEHYLPIAGLARESTYFTNAIRCMPVSVGGKLDIKREKDLELLNSCSSHFLSYELDSIRPRLVVPMGAFANRALDPDINLELQHGIPIRTSWGDTFPMYHPAQGTHEPKKMLLIRNDWIKLGKYLKGNLKVARDKYPNPDYRLADAQQVRRDLDGMWDYPMACDTETMKGGQPYCFTYSVVPGTGRLIMADDTAALEELQDHLDNWNGPILWHNWLFDIKVVTAMGLRFPHRLIVDTMLRIFHLGNLPQGLKALAYRELGMKMKDFDDVVTPHAIPLCLSYLSMASMESWPKPPEEIRMDAAGTFKLYKPQGFNTKLKRFFTDFAKNPNKDVFDAWANWEAMQGAVQEKLGAFPGKCISYANADEVLWYASRDADCLLRLWPVVKSKLRDMRRRPQQDWGETNHGKNFRARV